MALSLNQKNQITELLINKIENKLKSYGRETTSMPFLARLIQDNEKIAAYSFIHSMATTL
ncbi:MAG: TdeIII family type II restriction endonuclease, partial [Bacteroidales bacterium]|nr:TdeIII family type II restriction endonuclease [Bacteroidales bacterium]